jgi:hypothetical protein
VQKKTTMRFTKGHYCLTSKMRFDRLFGTENVIGDITLVSTEAQRLDEDAVTLCGLRPKFRHFRPPLLVRSHGRCAIAVRILIAAEPSKSRPCHCSEFHYTTRAHTVQFVLCVLMYIPL